MKTTRELLELAARALGIELDWGLCVPNTSPWRMTGTGGAYGPGAMWNPSTDDGDSARLESAMGLDVTWLEDAVWVRGVGEYYSDHNGDKQAARRMATLRAAALIGETK